DRQVDRIYVGGLRVPGGGARAYRAAGGVVPCLPGGARAARGRARGQPGDRPAVHGPTRSVSTDAGPPRLLDRAGGGDAAGPAGRGGRPAGRGREGGRPI